MSNRTQLYKVFAARPSASTIMWDDTNKVYGNLPFTKIRLNQRLSRVSEAEISVSRYYPDGTPLKLGLGQSQITGEQLQPVNTIIYIYRDNDCVWSGPLISIQGKGTDELTFMCKDWAYYMEKAFIIPTYTRTSDDIFSIAREIFQLWKDRHGNGGFYANSQTPPRLETQARKWTAPGVFSTNVNMGKTVAVRWWEHDHTSILEAWELLSRIGGTGFEFEWEVRHFTQGQAALMLPRIVFHWPDAGYETAAWTRDVGLGREGGRFEYGPGTRNTCDSMEWIIDGSGIINEAIAAGLGQGTQQQRAVYTGGIIPGVYSIAPLQDGLISDQALRRNDQASDAARVLWGENLWPKLTLRMTWHTPEYGGLLGWHETKPGIDVYPIFEDSFIRRTGTTKMRTVSWGIEVDADDELIFAELEE